MKPGVLSEQAVRELKGERTGVPRPRRAISTLIGVGKRGAVVGGVRHAVSVRITAILQRLSATADRTIHTAVEGAFRAV